MFIRFTGPTLRLVNRLILLPAVLRSKQFSIIPRIGQRWVFPALKKTQKPLIAGILFGAAKDSKAMSKIEQTVTRADQLYDEKKWDELYKFLKEALEDSENQHADVLWRMARACREKANTASNKDQKKDFTFEAFANSTRGVQMDPENGHCNKWQGILLDLTARFEGTKKRIQNSYLVKEHLEKAIKLMPEDAATLHSLGVWCFEFADLPWYQKKLAAAFFATPPESSYEEGLKYFLEAEKVSPHFYSFNLVYLGKTHLRLGDKAKAREVLDQCLKMENKATDDAEAKKEAADLLKKC